MTNIATLTTLRSLMSYLPDGVAAAVEGLVRFMPPEIKEADNLALYAFQSISTTKQEISDTAGAAPVIVIAKSTGTKAYVHFHNLDADSVTEGVDADWVVPVSSTSGEITTCFMGGASWYRFWDTGLTVSASTTVEASAAPTNKPDIWVIYTTT